MSLWHRAPLAKELRLKPSLTAQKKGGFMDTEGILEELKKWLKKKEEKAQAENEEGWNHWRLFPKEVLKKIAELEKK